MTDRVKQVMGRIVAGILRGKTRETRTHAPRSLATGL